MYVTRNVIHKESTMPLKSKKPKYNQITEIVNVKSHMYVIPTGV